MPASAPADATSIGPRRLSHVAVSTCVTEIRPAWDALLTEAPASAYQTPEWLLPWLDTLGRAMTPVFVVGSDDGGPLALLALGKTRYRSLTLARFLGTPDSNFGLGLFHPAVDWTPAMLHRLLAEAAQDARIDLLWLANQPFSFEGRENPLTRLPYLPSPSLQHEAALDKTGHPLDRILSTKARKHIRQKEARLAVLGSVRHVRAHDAATVDRLATALVAQRAARFGATSRDAALVAFLRQAAQPSPDGRAGLDLHGLFCGDTVVSVFAGARHAGRLSGQMLSFDASPAWARFSPGELLIARIMTEAGQAGVQRFDLGIGEARYKDSFCPVAMPLFDTFIGMSMRGRVSGMVLVAALRLKRRIKQDPRLWKMAKGWRVRLRRRRD